MTSTEGRFRWGSASDTGRVRTINQDRLFVAPTLFVVADGMGGHQAGEVAAEIAVEGFTAAGVANVDELTERIAAANSAILDAASDDTSKYGMGTTLTALALPTDDTAGLIVANVGDSRTYLFRHGDIAQVSQDHSLVGDLVREGRLTEAEATNHPRRNVVTRALGIEHPVSIDTFSVPIVPGDRFVLCSDGLTDEVSPSAIAAALRRLGDPQEAADELVRMANEAGGRDNVTVVVVDVLDDDGEFPRESDGRSPHTAAASAAAGASQFAAKLAVPDLASPPAHDPSDVAGSPARQSDDGVRPRRITGRSIGFVLALLALGAVAYWALNAAATGTYFVGLDGDDVVIYQGRPGGLLWFDPTVEEPTELTVADLPAAQLARLRDGVDQESLEDARVFVANLAEQMQDIEAAGGAGAVPTTTVPEAVTTATTATANPATSITATSTTAATGP